MAERRPGPPAAPAPRAGGRRDAERKEGSWSGARDPTPWKRASYGHARRGQPKRVPPAGTRRNLTGAAATLAAPWKGFHPTLPTLPRMSPPPRPREHGAAERRFLLASDPTSEFPRLTAEDERHARDVIRLGVGDGLIGLDGAGRAWPLAVRAIEQRRLVLDVTGGPRQEPAPGTGGTTSPRLVIGVSLPRGGRAEDMVDRLCQLGVARVVPLVAERTPPHGREAGTRRASRLLRAAREACKQCGRLWFLELAPPVAAKEFLAGAGRAPLAVLAPEAPESLGPWALRQTAEGARELHLAVGPEGGFTDEEETVAREHGATFARVAAHVLRIETAAEAAAAIVGEAGARD